MRSAWAFLTPFGGASTPGPHTLRWFPLVGAVLGALLGALWWGAWQWWPPAVVGGLVVAADLVATGLLHVDGLADAADGLLPHLTTARRLEVMRQPDVGAFGLAVTVITLVLRVLLFASLPGQAGTIFCIVGLFVLSRTAMAVVAATVPYARAEGGLASAFLPESADPLRWLCWGAGAIGGCGALVAGTRSVGGGLEAFVAVAALGAAVGLVVLVAWRRLGGFTGDVLGAACIVGETAGLLVLAGKW